MVADMALAEMMTPSLVANLVLLKITIKLVYHINVTPCSDPLLWLKIHKCFGLKRGSQI